MLLHSFLFFNEFSVLPAVWTIWTRKVTGKEKVGCYFEEVNILGFLSSENDNIDCIYLSRGRNIFLFRLVFALHNAYCNISQAN